MNKMTELFERGHNSCAGCGPAIAMRHIMKAAGKNTIVSIATGCMEVVSTAYPLTAWNVPLIHNAFENAAATASGIEKALEHLGKKDVNVIAIAGDGGTFDIGLQALSGMIERGHKVLFICYDNNAYMNCLSIDSLIMTENGLKKITEVKKGEKIYAFDQKNYDLVLKRCTGIFDNGIQKIFELNTLHHTIKATSNHPFLVLKRNGRGRKSYFVWKTLAELKKYDEIIVLKNLDGGKSHIFKQIKLSKKGDYKVNKINQIQIPEKSMPELMEFLGLYVGDGWTRTEKAETGFALPKNTESSRKLIKLYKKIFKKNITQKDKNYIYIYSINLARFIDSLGFGKGAKNKIIPGWVFTLPAEEKEAFIRGLMLSDGYQIKNSKRYVSASYNLLRSLRLLLQTRGYQVGKIHQQIKRKGTQCVYRKLLKDSRYGYICFSNKRNPNTSEYLSQIKQRDFLADNEYFKTERITSIEFVKEEPTLDLRVEGEHNFIADGIVVHNTGIQRSGATPKYAETTTSPYGDKIHGKQENKKNMPQIIASHGCYTATANIAYPEDFQKKIKKALSINGPSYIQVLSPCVPGWKYPESMTVQIARKAVESRVSVLYEIEDGVYKINMPIERPKPINEYIKMQGRFKHLTEKEIDEMQNNADSEYEKIKKLADMKIKVF